MINIIFLDAEEVIEINKTVIEKDGGLIGLRDKNLLLSALANPQNLFYYQQSDIYMVASSYAFSIIKNHAFLDGNKRTGYGCMGLFLIKNNIKLQFPRNTDEIIVKIATNDITMDEFSEWLKSLSECK